MSTKTKPTKTTNPPPVLNSTTPFWEISSSWNRKRKRLECWRKRRKRKRLGWRRYSYNWNTRRRIRRKRRSIRISLIRRSFSWLRRKRSLKGIIRIRSRRLKPWGILLLSSIAISLSSKPLSFKASRPGFSSVMEYQSPTLTILSWMSSRKKPDLNKHSARPPEMRMLMKMHLLTSTQRKKLPKSKRRGGMSAECDLNKLVFIYWNQCIMQWQLIKTTMYIRVN